MPKAGFIPENPLKIHIKKMIRMPAHETVPYCKGFFYRINLTYGHIKKPVTI